MVFGATPNHPKPTIYSTPHRPRLNSWGFINRTEVYHDNMQGFSKGNLFSSLVCGRASLAVMVVVMVVFGAMAMFILKMMFIITCLSWLICYHNDHHMMINIFMGSFWRCLSSHVFLLGNAGVKPIRNPFRDSSFRWFWTSFPFGYCYHLLPSASIC